MLGNASNLSTIDGKQAAAAAATAKKEDDAATVHRKQKALVVVMAAARKTLDEARAREHTAALAWEKEKTIAHHLEQQLTAAQGIKGSRSPRTMTTIAPSTSVPTLTPPSPRTCMHNLPASRTYDQWSRSF
jgi:hypothetical protein